VFEKGGKVGKRGTERVKSRLLLFHALSPKKKFEGKREKEEEKEAFSRRRGTVLAHTARHGPEKKRKKRGGKLEGEEGAGTTRFTLPIPAPAHIGGGEKGGGTPLPACRLTATPSHSAVSAARRRGKKKKKRRGGEGGEKNRRQNFPFASRRKKEQGRSREERG